jgi:hypothetical protein
MPFQYLRQKSANISEKLAEKHKSLKVDKVEFLLVVILNLVCQTSLEIYTHTFRRNLLFPAHRTSPLWTSSATQGRSDSRRSMACHRFRENPVRSRRSRRRSPLSLKKTSNKLDNSTNWSGSSLPILRHFRPQENRSHAPLLVGILY